MSLFGSSWFDELAHPHHVRDQHFGLGFHPESLSVLPRDSFFERPSFFENRVGSAPWPSRSLHPRPAGHHGHYYRPWGELMRRENDSGISTVKADKDNFQVVLDVQQFAPEEINVKVVDKHIVVEGNHKEKPDEHGWISRNFTRRYLIPDQCNLEKTESKLSSDGVLTISIPRKDLPKVEGERVISINHTGKPAIREKESEKKDEK